MGHMVRKQVYLTSRQNDLLRRTAQAARRSEAEVLREALDQFFDGQDAHAPTTESDPLWGIVGLADLPDDALSEQVDDELYGPVDE
jgi:hypothetical protein